MGHRRILNPKILALALGSLLTAFALWAYAEGTVAAGDTASLTQLASVTVSNAAVTATPMPVPATATVYPAAIATGAVSPVMATAEPLATSSSIQTAAPVQMAVTASAAPALRVAQLALFQDTQSLTNPRNTVNVSFLLLNNTVLAGDATLSLHLEASDTLIDARSTVTIALNGENIATGRILDVVQNRGGIWQTTVPSRLIRTDGTGNALTVLTMQRSIEGECADIDNPSNWVKLLADSTLKFPIAQEGSFQLANLYEALFERVEAGDTLTTDLILDDPARIATVASMLRFCSAAGAYKPQKGALRLSVKPFGGDIGDANNQIRFGLFAVQRSADEQYRQIAPQTGYLMLEQSEDRLEMTIGGADDTGLRKAIDFAVRKDYLAGAEGTEVTVETDPGAPTVTLPDSRTGMYSFADFGYPTTMLKGAFHQQAVFSLSQPNGMKGGARSYLQLHYRHSQTLISDQSLMTVYINGDPVGSVKLSASNANDGSYKIALPEDALNAPTLTLRVEVYHYLGTVDCSKDYSDTAWTSIEADSAVYLEPSDTLVRPTLAGFPNIPATDSAAGAYMVLPDNASEGALTLAAALAVRAGQNSGYPICWEATRADLLPSQPQDHLLWIGPMGDVSLPEAIRDVLPIAPDENGVWTVYGNLPVTPETLRNKIICEVARSPWNQNKLVTVMVYPAEWEETTLRLLESKDGLQAMDGHVSLIDADGTVTPYDVPTDQGADEQILITPERVMYLWESKTGTPFWLLPVLLCVLALGAIQIVRLARRTNRLKNAADNAGLSEPKAGQPAPKKQTPHDLDQ